jgi:hypothetical protein
VAGPTRRNGPASSIITYARPQTMVGSSKFDRMLRDADFGRADRRSEEPIQSLTHGQDPRRRAVI